ncbi:hypothetical protein Scep_005723 [Stephania cephalantha]|uniref:Myb/SANT-like DNA-binding domain-containing protein n=1 Tax=Stephania cephalantha TaxID=152367 RepID=A0AAP0KXZ6_9MAGN
MEDQGAQITTTPSGPTRQTNHNSSGGREDCWSEGATSALIEAWGDRYLQLSRGNLRQKDWKEVADAVNSRRDGVKPPRTDVQCKNRVDTLKKKYKAEKAKPIPSKWPFYSRLDHLVGTAAAAATAAAAKKAPQKAPAPSAPAVTKFTVKNMNLGFGRNSPSPVVAAMMEGGGYSGGGGGGGGGGSSTKRSRSSGSWGMAGERCLMGMGRGSGNWRGRW